MPHGLGDLLKYSEHRTLADREVTPSERTMCGELLNSFLEQVKLVWMEWI
jgi:hypothetical protein